MKVLGLITEYNPFHNGHLYHLKESISATGATHSVAVMSGNFLQRGEPTLVHKWARAEMAVSSGVDLVIELPTVYACATAELFAYGSVKLLDMLGIVDCLCFGSESGEMHYLKLIAEVLMKAPAPYTAYLKEELAQGLTFPVARARALHRCFSESDTVQEQELKTLSLLLKSPNNILSIEYLKSLMLLKSSIQPYTILRKKADYHSTEFYTDIASATAIREHLRNEKPSADLKSVMPQDAYRILQEQLMKQTAPIFGFHFEQMLLAVLRRETAAGIGKYFDVTEGLENKISQCAQACQTLSDLYSCIKSKRYTMTRVQRIAMHTLLNVTKQDIEYFNSEGGPQYIRVLAFNDKGRELLKRIKLASPLKIITKLPSFRPQGEAARKMLEIDIKATNIYRLAVPNKEFAAKQLDYVMSPVYVKNEW